MENTETIILVATRFGTHSVPDWKPWPEREFDDVVKEVAERVKENHRQMEVREVKVIRHVSVNPVVETVSVIEEKNI